ncbi:MAG: exosome complex RNA-binding protein Rrp4 [Thermoplasmata archaeon]|nr:exosome complex RNA-binding protein Rrp4 [Thermoplasmata archaeon]
MPGEEVPGRGLKPGPGTYRVNGRIYASVLGLLTHKPPVVRVIPLSGRYIPKAHDTVVGTVTDVQGTFWLLDIGAPRWAPLHMTGTPWKIDFGETAQYLRVGDSVVVGVEAIENTGRIGVTMIGDGLGKLEGGTIVTLSPAKIPRVIGRGGSMIQTITRHTGARIVVGQNGRIWIDGAPEQLVRVRAVLTLIEEEGHRSGLTERVEGLLRAGDAPPGAGTGAIEPHDPDLGPVPPFDREPHGPGNGGPEDDDDGPEDPGTGSPGA